MQRNRFVSGASRKHGHRQQEVTMTTSTGMTIQKIMGLDGLTCLGAGVLMAAAGAPIAALTELPQLLLFWAGLALLPVAVLFFVMSRMAPLPKPLLWIAVLGNLAWLVASIGVLAMVPANALGAAFVLAQAAVVAVLTVLEARSMSTRTPLAA
jgi:hypothetical protein